MSRDVFGSRKTIALVVVAGLGVSGLGVAGMFAFVPRHERAAPIPALAVQPKPPAPRPSLYCDFYDFTRARVVVSFDFAVDGLPAHPRFAERSIVEPDGTRTDFDAGSLPAWAYALDDGTPTIASPADETRIVLYGLQPRRGGVFWTEAGLRSNRYRNLEGKCRQAYFADGAAVKGATP